MCPILEVQGCFLDTGDCHCPEKGPNSFLGTSSLPFGRMIVLPHRLETNQANAHFNRTKSRKSMNEVSSHLSSNVVTRVWKHTSWLVDPWWRRCWQRRRNPRCHITTTTTTTTAGAAANIQRLNKQSTTVQTANSKHRTRSRSATTTEKGIEETAIAAVALAATPVARACLHVARVSFSRWRPNLHFVSTNLFPFNSSNSSRFPCKQWPVQRTARQTGVRIC